VNLPGKYSDYAANPWKYVWGDIEQVMAGTYQYFYPQRTQTTTAPAADAPKAPGAK
jgi:hypothetical protein